jgi:hypothetical protein
MKEELRLPVGHEEWTWAGAEFRAPFRYAEFMGPCDVCASLPFTRSTSTLPLSRTPVRQSNKWAEAYQNRINTREAQRPSSY